MAGIRLDQVTVAFGDDEPPVLEAVDLDIAEGEMLAIAGPSGSGKTTILRVIAGLLEPTSGRVLFDGEDRTDTPAAERGVAMVFQDYALYAHLNAERNITFPLETARVKPEHERRRRARDEASHLGIEHLLERYPGQLAAGHRQAVATARSLVKRSGVLLLDEPLVHLDARARVAGRVEVQRLHRESGTTIVYVTNDQAEAMAVGERVAILAGGRIQQVAPPMEVFERPANMAVARFLGTPPMSLVPAEVVGDAGDLSLLVGTDRLPLGIAAGLEEWVGTPVTMGIRPNHLRIGRPGARFDRCLHGRVVGVEDQGDTGHAVVDLGVAGASVTVTVTTPPAVQIGERVELLVTIEAIRFFDPATGEAISGAGAERPAARVNARP